jgi:CRP/FNR family nitrogen fixation transcriptional regulator
MKGMAQRPPGAPSAIGVVRYFTPGQCIFSEDNPAAHFMLVVGGLVRSCSIFADGRRFIGAFYAPGDIFGFEPGTYRATAEAVCETSLVVYHSADLTGSRQMMDSMMHRIDQSCAHARRLGRFSAIERLASFLLECSDRAPQRQMLTLEMTRQDIADYLGLTVETVSRSLQQLCREGLIDIISPRQLVLCDIATLRAISL